MYIPSIYPHTLKAIIYGIPHTFCTHILDLRNWSNSAGPLGSRAVATASRRPGTNFAGSATRWRISPAFFGGKMGGFPQKKMSDDTFPHDTNRDPWFFEVKCWYVSWISWGIVYDYTSWDHDGIMMGSWWDHDGIMMGSWWDHDVSIVSKLTCRWSLVLLDTMGSIVISSFVQLKSVKTNDWSLELVAFLWKTRCSKTNGVYLPKMEGWKTAGFTFILGTCHIYSMLGFNRWILMPMVIL